MAKTVAADLHAALRRHRVVRLTVVGNTLSGAAPFGIPVALSADMVVMQFFRDFRPDGFVAVAVDKIENVVIGGFERTYTEVCSAEGTIKKIKLPLGIDTTSQLDMLADLRRRAKFVAVMVAGKSTSKVSIGQLQAVGETGVSLRPFDATGTWQPRMSIGLTDILDIQWGSRYLRVWQRYLT